MNYNDTIETGGLATRDSWTLSNVERLGAGATAAILIAYGLSRRSLSGACLALAAIPLAYRGFTGSWPAQLERLGMGNNGDSAAALSGERGVHVRESVRVEKPLQEVYRFWRRLENLPQFMTYLQSVTDRGDGRSHWVARGPADVRVEWDAEIVNEVENSVIGWRSLPGSSVITAGSVNFDAVRGGSGTQLTVHLQYSAPGGPLASWVAWMFGREPSQTIREDLRRLKQILEAGELPVAGQADARRARNRTSASRW
jgi:uncharacterized membrane protein